MREATKAVWLETVAVALFIIALVAVACFFSGCKTSRELKKSTNDSTSVKKETSGQVKLDSSGSKSDKTNTKETVYYPQPIYIEGKNGETKVVFVPQTVKETGTEKSEDFSVKKDESWREAFDSLSSKILLLSQQSSTKVGFSTFEIIMMIAGGIIALKMFAPSIIKLITKT